jgi:hypothetical protein
LKGRDEVSFTAHATLGTALDALGCDAGATGLQWLKAAAHARDAGDVARAGDGLQVAARRLGSTQALTMRLCPYVSRGYVNSNQKQAAELAGLSCTRP